MLYEAAKPVLFALPAETAHESALAALRVAHRARLTGYLADRYVVTDPRLEIEAFGQLFSNPVGVAAGFDKDAQVPGALAAFGFGHVEVGGITAEPQAGNKRPRLFRLPEDEALINRFGFNNEGADVVGTRLAKQEVSVPVGINIGKSKTTPIENAEEDYRYTYERVAAGGDYFVVNVSSPNTPGLRELQQRERLEAILSTLQTAGADPLLVKLSPDLPDPAVEEAIAVAEELSLDGIIATNTTTERPASLRNQNHIETGGLSGAPIETEATRMVRFVAERTDIPVVGVGGVADAKGAYAKIRAGARVVQLYTAFVFEGPSVAHDINTGLLDLLERDGFDSIEDAVGADLN
jgi:dihydroorotate dehydrogenase